jgi:arginase
MQGQRTARVFGIPMDLGQQRRGVDMGPSAIRYADLNQVLKGLGLKVCDHGNLFVPQAEEMPREMADPSIGRAYYLPQVAAICQEMYDTITTTLQPHEIGVFLGGDHSLSIGTVSAVLKLFGGEKVGVLWVDAHADMNSPHTSPSGNIHGMSVAALLGDGPAELTDIGYAGPKIQADQVAMVGIRNLDPDERLKLKQSGIFIHTMREVDELGMSLVAHRILDHFANYDTIHVSLDLDSCDPTIAPGVGTPVNGGLSYREAHLLMEILADSGKVRTVDIVEVNPVLDNHNTTAEIAVELVASLFGQRIL